MLRANRLNFAELIGIALKNTGILAVAACGAGELGNYLVSSRHSSNSRNRRQAEIEATAYIRLGA